MLRLFCIIALVALAGPARAQISPGELARAHASLEGMKNCLKCHELGAGPSADKCLECHRAIRSRIDAKAGYHFRVVAQGGEACFTCHSDHAGRGFDLVHWPDGRDGFDHAQAGWALAGAHAKLECGKCHRAEHVDAALTRTDDTVDPAHTFLGLETACASCHNNPHAGQFDRDCASCHGEDAWKPASRFDHARTAFVLRGRHAKLECAACHKPGDVGGKTAVRFAASTGIDGRQCTSCHTDPHKSRFGADCASCHGEDAWKPVTKFDHARTAFPLTGKHRSVKCETCHKGAAAAAEGEYRYAGLAHDNCTSCHKDPHQQRLGTNCESCHSTAGWKNVVTAKGKGFDHSRTRYPLEGRHASVACEKCHTGESKTAGLKFDTCTRCHADAHAGQFAARADGGACESCHDVGGFVPARFAAEDHAATRFKLAGAHLAQPCIACHRMETFAAGVESRRFAFDDIRCSGCHDDPHGGQFQKSAPVKACEACHGVSSWQTLAFDHDRDSKYKLEGQHRRVACDGCHLPVTEGSTTVARYRGVATSCDACHSVEPARLGGSL